MRIWWWPNHSLGTTECFLRPLRSSAGRTNQCTSQQGSEGDFQFLCVSYFSDFAPLLTHFRSLFLYPTVQLLINYKGDSALSCDLLYAFLCLFIQKSFQVENYRERGIVRVGHYGHLKDLGFAFETSWRDEKTLLIRNGRFVKNSRSRIAKTFVESCAYM